MARSLQFGVALWGMQAFKSNPRHHVKLYEEMIEDARLAEELGFDTLWLTEHHFWYDGYCPSLLVAAGAIAAATRRIQVGTGVLLLPMHDPLRVAEGAAVADIVSGGRFQLGVGVGYRDVEFDGFGIARKERGARMEEALDILNLAWTQERFSYQGRYHRYSDVSVTPKPVRRPIPVWIGGWAEAVVQRSARRGLNLIGASGRALELYERTAREAGVDISQARIAVGGDVWVDDDEERARREMVPLLRYLYREQLGGWHFFPGVGLDHPQLDAIVEMAVARAVIGTPETVVSKLGQQLEANPLANHVFCRVRFDSVPRHRLRHCLELLAQEVMPRLKKEAAVR